MNEKIIGDNPLVSVLVVNYNGKKYLGKILDDCISSVLTNDYKNFEIIFIDNGSSDSSVEHVKSLFGYDKRFKILALNKNYGTTGAKNRGIKYSNGEYIILLNTDIEFKRDTISKMIDVMEERRDIGIISCKLVSSNGNLQSEGESFSNVLSFIGSVYPELSRKIQRLKIVKEGNKNIVDWIPGAALMIRRNLIKKLNFYDEDYFMYSEEVDLAYRVIKSGNKIVCLNDCEVIHYGKLTSKHYSSWQRDLEARNQLLFVIKNFSNRQLALKILYYVMGIFSHFLISFIKNDELEWKIGLSKIKAFSYMRKPAQIPN